MKITINQKTINNVTSASERLGEVGRFLVVTFYDNVSVDELEVELKNVNSMILEKTDSTGAVIEEDLSSYKTLLSIDKKISDKADDITTFQMRA